MSIISNSWLILSKIYSGYFLGVAIIANVSETDDRPFTMGCPYGLSCDSPSSNTGVAWYLNGVSSWGLFFSQDWLLKLLLSKAKLQVSTLVCLPCAWKKTKFMFVVFQIDVFGIFLNIGAAHRWTAHRGQSIGDRPIGDHP